MDQLPDEIVVCILGFLDVQCVYNAGRTCKRVYRLLPNVASEVAGGWQHVPQMRPGGEAALKRLAFVLRRESQLAGFPYSGLLTLDLRGFRGDTKPAFDAVHVSVSELADGSHALALDPDGRVWSMGSNNFGGLGREGGGDAFLPVTGLPGTARSVTVYYGTSAAVLNNGELWAWGRNAMQERLVPGRQQPIYPFPIRLTVPEPVVQVALGASHALALTRDGNVYGLGSNACLELGFPLPTKEHCHHSSFTRMRIRGRAVKVAAGGLCSILLMSTGRLFACGTEMRGELGCEQGTRCLRRLTPVFAHLGPILDVEARHISTAVITRKGQLYVCGYDCGGWEHRSPTLVEADEPIISCALTNSFGVCFKTASGRVERYSGSPIAT
jgi:hypothetical protein